MRLLFFFPTLSPPPHFTFFLYLHLTGQCDDISRYHFLLKTLAHVCNIRVCVYVRAYVSHANMCSRDWVYILYCMSVAYEYAVYIFLHATSLFLSFSLFHTHNHTVVRESSSSLRTHIFSHAFHLFDFVYCLLFFFFFPRNINTFEIGRSGKSLARIEKENYKRNVILRYIDEDTRIVDQVCTKERIRRKFFFYPLL